VVAGNFASGNAGLSFYMDIICPTLAIILIVIAKRREKRSLPAFSSSK
jgi:hypothetical protein